MWRRIPALARPTASSGTRRRNATGAVTTMIVMSDTAVGSAIPSSSSCEKTVATPITSKAMASTVSTFSGSSDRMRSICRSSHVTS